MQKTLTLISYNVFGAPFHGQRLLKTFLKTHVRKRFRLIAQEISKRDTDLLLFQEVHTYPHLYILKKALPPHFFVYFQPGIYGPKGGVVTFSKIKAHKKTFVDFAEKGSVLNKSVTGPLTQRGMLLIHLTNSSIWILNTHLTQNSSGDWSEKNSYSRTVTQQLRQCSSLVKSLRSKGYQVILGGDFNTPATTPYYQDFLTDAKVTDVFSGDTTPTDIEWFEGKKFAQRIDYIFHSGDTPVKIEDKKLLFTEPLQTLNGDSQLLSDHVALEAKLKLS